MFKLKLVSLSI